MPPKPPPEVQSSVSTAGVFSGPSPASWDPLLSEMLVYNAAGHGHLSVEPPPGTGSPLKVWNQPTLGHCLQPANRVFKTFSGMRSDPSLIKTCVCRAGLSPAGVIHLSLAQFVATTPDYYGGAGGAGSVFLF